MTVVKKQIGRLSGYHCLLLALSLCLPAWTGCRSTGTKVNNPEHRAPLSPPASKLRDKQAEHDRQIIAELREIRKLASNYLAGPLPQNPDPSVVLLHDLLKDIASSTDDKLLSFVKDPMFGELKRYKSHLKNLVSGTQSSTDQAKLLRAAHFEEPPCQGLTCSRPNPSFALAGSDQNGDEGSPSPGEIMQFNLSTSLLFMFGFGLLELRNPASAFKSGGRFRKAGNLTMALVAGVMSWFLLTEEEMTPTLIRAASVVLLVITLYFGKEDLKTAWKALKNLRKGPSKRRFTKTAGMIKENTEGGNEDRTKSSTGETSEKSTQKKNFTDKPKPGDLLEHKLRTADNSKIAQFTDKVRRPVVAIGAVVLVAGGIFDLVSSAQGIANPGLELTEDSIRSKPESHRLHTLLKQLDRRVRRIFDLSHHVSPDQANSLISEEYVNLAKEYREAVLAYSHNSGSDMPPPPNAHELAALLSHPKLAALREKLPQSLQGSGSQDTLALATTTGENTEDEASDFDEVVEEVKKPQNYYGILFMLGFAAMGAYSVREALDYEKHADDYRLFLEDMRLKFQNFNPKLPTDDDSRPENAATKSKESDPLSKSRGIKKFGLDELAQEAEDLKAQLAYLKDLDQRTDSAEAEPESSPHSKGGRSENPFAKLSSKQRKKKEALLQKKLKDINKKANEKIDLKTSQIDLAKKSIWKFLGPNLFTPALGISFGIALFVSQFDLARQNPESQLARKMLEIERRLWQQRKIDGLPYPKNLNISKR